MTLLPLLIALTLQTTPAADAPPEMITYQMVFFWKGAVEPDPSVVDSMQRGHLAHLVELNRQRVNLLFGPFVDEGDLRGLAVLQVPDADAARTLFADDPYVKAGAMRIEVKPWMGPEGWFHPPVEKDVMRPGALEPLVFGFLMRGRNRTQSAEEAQRLQKGHLAYMDALHKAGKLIMAGPFLDDSEWRGVVVYRVATLEEAAQLAAGDPMVKAGRLRIDAKRWTTLKGILR